MLKGIVFDMDGLLFDTERLAIEGLMHAGEVMDCHIDKSIIMQTIGHNLQSTIEIYRRHLGDDFDFKKAHTIHREYIAEQIKKHGAPLKPGVMELIAYIKEKGYKVALASSSEKDRIELCLASVNLLDFFAIRISGDMIEKSKPEPDIYLAACKAMGVAPQDCAAIEDSPAGITAAHRGGLYPIMVPDLIEPTEEIRRIAHCVLEDLTQVPGVLEAI